MLAKHEPFDDLRIKLFQLDTGFARASSRLRSTPYAALDLATPTIPNLRFGIPVSGVHSANQIE